MFARLLTLSLLLTVSESLESTESEGTSSNIKDCACGNNDILTDIFRTLEDQYKYQTKLIEDLLSYREAESQSLPTNCYEVMDRGQTTSGVYTIQPSTYPEPFPVYCDMDTDGGGWTVFQRREDGSVDFYRDWTSYKDGFGNVNSEFWLGNEKLFYLTAQGQNEGRVDLLDFEGETRYAVYDKFRIGDANLKYKLILGAFSGNAGDSLASSNNFAFTTHDSDNDGSSSSNCAVSYKGAWWYSSCHNSNLNGLYLAGEHEPYATGVNWNFWKGYHYSLKQTEMKVRPLPPSKPVG